MLLFSHLTIRQAGWQFPGFPKGRGGAATVSAGFSFWNGGFAKLEAPCHCWTYHVCLRGKGKFWPLCAHSDAWLVCPVVPPLLLSSCFFLPLCYVIYSRLGQDAMLFFFNSWISLLLAILLGCPIHRNLTTPPPLGEFCGKVQGMFFLLDCAFPVIQQSFRGSSFTMFYSSWLSSNGPQRLSAIQILVDVPQAMLQLSHKARWNLCLWVFQISSVVLRDLKMERFSW